MGGTGPWPESIRQLLKSVTKEPFFLPIKGKTLRIALLIDVMNNILNIGVNIDHHFINLLDSSLYLPFLYLAYLYCRDTLIGDCLQVDVSDLFDVV